MSGEVQASHHGQKLIKAWQEAVDREQRARSEMTAATNAESAARRELVKWLAPGDATPGEKFAIWNQDRHGNEVLFEVVVPNTPIGAGDIKIRRRK